MGKRKLEWTNGYIFFLGLFSYSGAGLISPGMYIVAIFCVHFSCLIVFLVVV